MTEFGVGPEAFAPPPAPRELPQLRIEMLRNWQEGALFDIVLKAKRAGDESLSPQDQASLHYASWERRTLERAALWWIAEPMCHLLWNTMSGVPDDVHLHELPVVDDPALMCGFAVFAAPFVGTSAENGQPLTVAAITWGGVRLPPMQPRFPEGTNGLAVSAYGSFVMPDNDDVLKLPAVRGPDGEYTVISAPMHTRMWYPMGRTDWPATDAIGERSWEMTDVAFASYVEDRKLLAALWTLLHQKGIASTTIDRGHRQLRRRMEREGRKPSDAEVRLVTLRAARREYDADPDKARTQREHDHQWIVNGHWRNQPYGTGRKLRRLQWIAPYTKGPEGAPLKQPETVRIWKR